MKNATNVKVTEERRISAYDVRQLCIKNEWYTAGDCKDYSEMLDYVEENCYNANGVVIYNIACDIKAHSSTDADLDFIMFELGQITETFFEVEGIEESRYTMCYYGHIFAGDSKCFNIHNIEADQVGEMINAYADADIEIVDNEYNVGWRRGEWS